MIADNKTIGQDGMGVRMGLEIAFFTCYCCCSLGTSTLSTLAGLCKAVLLVLTFRRHCRSLEIGRGVGD